MNIVSEQPDSIEGFQQVLKTARSESRTITITGAGSKIRLGESDQRLVVSTSHCSGVVDHQASDFTITVRAGTPVRDVMAVLDGAGQFLPFDPVFANRGATVGGMIAAGMNGPCRLRYGGLRDFVIGCQFIDGMGNVIRAGGKVVKNAAGFDLPKFLVGTAGKFGLLLEATFKVFPKPLSYQTLVTVPVDMDVAAGILRQLLDSRIDFDAIEILESSRVAVRWSGECKAEHNRIEQAIGVGAVTLAGDVEQEFWNDLANFADCKSGTLIAKVPVTRGQISALAQRLSVLKVSYRIGAAGNVAIIILPIDSAIGALEQHLVEMGLSGQVVVGTPDHYILGVTGQLPCLKRIKSALDPDGVFGPIEREVGMAQ